MKPVRADQPRWTEPCPELATGPPPDVGQLYRLHGALVAGWAARLLGPGADVDDVVQDVFLVVQRRVRDFRGQARVTTWLYAITLRVAKGWRRRRRLRQWLGLGDDARIDALPSERASPLQELETRQATAMVYRVLDRLRERDRTILVLFEIERLSGEEIAVIERTSLNNVWSRIRRARARFLTAYQALERGPEAAGIEAKTR
jgi:RNA polymerase sigma-70 factor (ECF subfamily)